MKVMRGHKVPLAVLLQVLLIVILMCPAVATPLSQKETGKVVLYFFWGDGCPHCAKEKIYLDMARKKYPQLEVKSYEVWHNGTNAVFFSQMLEAAGVKSSGVPVTFIHTEVFAGFNDRTAEEIENKIQYCIQNIKACVEPSERSLSPVSQKRHQIVKVPFLGDIDLSVISLPVMTVILGGLDSFNPCAFFVLFFLLSLLIHAKSRKRMFLIGGTFVFFSGFIYFVFMAAWLNLFMVAGQLLIITVAAGIIALTVAVINIKDFFFFSKGVSLSIPEKAKPKLFERMRNLLKATSVSSMLMGTVVLAIAANSYELLCTAGFPMVFTRLLTLQDLTTGQYYLYLAMYNFVYVVPLATIVVIFTVTLGAKKITEWQGRKLKLLSGLMMFFLGLILLIDPALLNNIFVAAAILAAVFILFALIIFLAKKFAPILPGKKL
ncbi:MAG: thioredoxin family protein [Thermodesulfovibrionales bacterium]